MEVIRKKICLETAKSRKQGLLAYISGKDYTKVESSIYYEKKCNFDEDSKPEYVSKISELGTSGFIFVDTDNKDGNYGGYVCNPYFSGGTGSELFGVGYSSYSDIIYHYNKIHNMLISGVKLKHIITHGENLYISEFDDFVDINDYKIVDSSSVVSLYENVYKVDDEKIDYETIKYLDDCGNEIEKTVAKKTSVSTYVGDYINCVSDYDYLISLCKFFGGIENIYKFCEFVEDNFIGKLTIPKEITGDNVPEYLYYCDIYEYYDWFFKHEGDNDCCIKIEWKKRGGDKMYDFLKSSLHLYEEAVERAKIFFVVDNSSLKKHVPKINISIFIHSIISDVGILNPYEDEDESYRYSGYTEDMYIENGTANSRLDELKIPNCASDDNGNILPGIFTENKYKIYRKTKIGDKLYWKRIDNISYDDFNEGLYNGNLSSLTIPPKFLCDPQYGEEKYECSSDDKYCEGYFIVSKYSGKLEIPYKTASDGYVYNESIFKYYDSDGNAYSRYCKIKNNLGTYDYCYEMVGDYIKSITITGDKIKFEYIIGGHYWAKKEKTDFLYYNNGDESSKDGAYYYKYISDVDEPNGIKYEEEFDYYPNSETDVAYMFKQIDQIDESESSEPCTYSDGDIEERCVKYDFIDFESAKVKINHEALGLERYGLVAKITNYRAMDPFAAGYFKIDVVPYGSSDIVENGDEKNTLTLEGYNRESIKTPIYKDECLNRINMDASVNVDVSINRGNASSDSVHMKICECNTFEDLENYGNNYFNL